MNGSSKPVYLATLAFLLAFVSCLLHNYDTNTSPQMALFSAGKIPIGFGWPMVGVEGEIEHETEQLATCAQQLWAALESPHIRWLGVFVNLAVAVVLSVAMFSATQWMQARLHLKLTVGACLGFVAFAAMVVRNRQLSWKRMEGVVPDFPKVDMTSALFDYSETMVWIAMFACCIWLPQFVMKMVFGRK